MPTARKASSLPEKRLLKIIAFILSRPSGVTREEVWEEFAEDYGGGFAAKDKMWTRDKAAIEAAGVPLRFVQGLTEGPGGYQIDPREFHQPEVGFTDQEIAVLRAAGSAVTRLGGHPWHSELESALRKLRWFQGPVTPPARFPPPPPLREVGEHEAHFVELLASALEKRKRVRLTYFTAKSLEDASREVDLYGLAWRRGVWLFAGHCHLRQALRVFYVSRVRDLEVHGPNPGKADYAIPKDFDIRIFSEQQSWEYWVHEPLTVEALFRPRPGEALLASFIAQQLPGARLEETPQGVVARVSARNSPALVRHAFSLGLDVEVLGPPKVRAEARALLEAVAAGRER